MNRDSLKRTTLALTLSTLFAHSIILPAQAAEMQQDGGPPCAEKTGQVAGALIGAVLGGLLGNQVGKGNGRKIATVAGALGGLALGNYIGSEMDRRKCELAKIAERNGLTMTVTEISADTRQPNSSDSRVGLSVSVEDTQTASEAQQESGGDSLGNAAMSSQFESGSDLLNPNARSYFRDVANTYATPFRPDAIPPGATREQLTGVQQLRQRRVLVVGHTDDTGSSRLNADLSERRAQAVARLLAEAGMPETQIYFQGAGETQPLADNRTEQGRARNRRVEIVDLDSAAQFDQYLAARRTNVQYYRVAPQRTAPPSAPKPAEISAQMADGQVALAPPAPAKGASRAHPKAASAAPVAHATATNAVPALAAAAPVARPEYDFGGRPAADGAQRDLQIGKLLTAKKGFSFDFISSAQADDLPFARSCKDDRPRVANAVKSLQGGREYHVSDYMPGLYGTSWKDEVNGNLVALVNVAVLRDGGAPARKPTLLVYKAGRAPLTADTRADFRATPDVNTYQGENGLLYRVFVDGPVKCMDIVFRREQPSFAANSNLYYNMAGKTMVADFSPKIINKQ